MPVDCCANGPVAARPARSGHLRNKPSCNDCIAELPKFNAYHEQYTRQQVFAITYDDAKTTCGFVEQLHFDWPTVHDGNACSNTITRPANREAGAFPCLGGTKPPVRSAKLG
ncbi:MAG: peroxiredoxin family protein [Rhodanobacteraceae bacterium]